MLVRCNQCGRTVGQKSSDQETPSTKSCAKCYAFLNKDYFDDTPELRDKLKKRYIEPEESGEVVWEGEEPSYTDDELKIYNEVLAEVRREKEGTGEDRK